MRVLKALTSAIVYIAAPPAKVHRAPGPSGLMLAGMGWGLVTIGLWDLCSRLTWEPLVNWVVPACVCAAATVLGAYRRAFLGGLASLPKVRRPLQWIALLAIAAGWAVMLNDALRYWDRDWPTQQLSPAILWLWPPALYRVLLLMPTWGSWAMLGVIAFHRGGEHIDEPTRALAGRTSPVSVALWLALPLAGTFIYLMFLDRPARFLPPAAAIVAALGGGAAIVRLRGRPDRLALLATNVLTQAAFLLAYLQVR